MRNEGMWECDNEIMRECGNVSTQMALAPQGNSLIH